MKAGSSSSDLYTSVFFLGFAYNFVIALNFTNNALYPLYIRHEGGGVALVGLFMGLFGVASVAGRPLVGFLIDRYGARSMLIAGSLLLGLPAAGYHFLLDTGLGAIVWILRGLQGFGYGAHFSAAFTLAGQIAPVKRRNESIAMYGMSGLLGSVAGPYIGEVLVEGPGLHYFFLMMIGTGILAAIIISFVKTEQQTATHPPSVRSLIDLLMTPRLRPVLFLGFCLAITFSTPATFLATLAKSRGIEQFSLYFTCWGLAGAMTRIIGGRWGDRYGYRRVLIPGFLLYGAGMIIIHFSGNITGFIAAGVFSGAAHGITFPAVTSLGYTLAPSESTGSTMALVTGFMDAGNSFTALAIGPLAQMIGLGIVFPFAAIASLSAFGAVLWSVTRAGKSIIPPH